MNKQPLVSCIIIFLDGEKFIEEAIASIFSQTYPNWELLLVDDGSTDNSTVIALEYTQKYPEKVRYLEHENHQNRGMSASRNWGIDHAQGEYIAFLDADDIWLSHKLEQQVAILESQPEAEMVYGWVQFWHSWTGNSEDSQSDKFMELGVVPNTLIQPPKLLIHALNSPYQPPAPSNVIIRREVFEKVGRFEESFRGFGEDKVFFVKIQLNLPIFVSDECWIKYRRHPDSCCDLVNKDKKLIATGDQDFFNWIEPYLLNKGMKNTEVWQALQIAMTKSRLRYRHSILYSLWLDFLNLLMLTGRQILPNKVRHWLWTSLGSKLYG
ncbi:glycosyltransferase family 2 protein [Nodularia harveyana UHCC-0300]|uniref:Glycosyltransferase family 2 protein n=1 Tax=Nodularia harveyana UHCC-0300 TaxID=2974287 RepID=A0ABU5UIN2_9CYAN|nr:glycosyltransferase family 2 protein [Nodularia harveyana]MEA5583198.1 glycosyltransferase family 2 protein [Nodularia harveyana UHCC-0300]